MTDATDSRGLRPARPERRRKAESALRSELPQPEDVFLAWRLWLPEGTDVAAAARREVARLERHTPLRPELKRLRDLFLEAIEAEKS